MLYGCLGLSSVVYSWGSQYLELGTWEEELFRRKGFYGRPFTFGQMVSMPKGGESREPFREINSSWHLMQHMHFFGGEWERNTELVREKVS